MTNMNSFERGRATGLPGTVTTVTLYPQRLSVRMRNSIIRMLEARIINGGWASKSRQIAEKLAEKYGLQVALNNNYRGLRVVGLSEQAAPLIKEAVHADWTAFILENPEYRKGYYYSQYEHCISAIERRDPNFYITLHENYSIRKVCEILAEHTTQELKDKSKQIADLLRRDDPIHLTSF